MDYRFKLVHYGRKTGNSLCPVKRFGPENAKKVLSFLSGFPEYAPTPLVGLPELSKALGVASIHVKDESKRFGLNAFKVLGGSYAIGNYIAKQLGTTLDKLPYSAITGKDVREKLGDVTFVTATDGNHGRGVAWTANRLGQKCVIYMPEGTAPQRLKVIRDLGAAATVTNQNYDGAVALARESADKYGWVLVQDTCWEGYEEIPGWIMQGYTAMAAEAARQLGGEKITHVFLQAGVGSMAGAVTAFFADLYGDAKRPVITIVEPDKADCIFRTAASDDDRLHSVTGRMDTIMAGLACGTPCSIGWHILHDHADNFVSIPDAVAAKGMRVLGNPLGGDPRIISGESGASTMGLVAETMLGKELSWLRDRLHLDGDSRILCISTEGDTDAENYRKIVWDGLYPSI